MSATSSPPSRASAAAARGSSDRSPLDADAAERRGQLPDERCVEDLLLAEEAHGPPDLRRHVAHRQPVEVAVVVRHEDRGTVLRDVLQPVDVEAHPREHLRPGEGLDHPLRLEADELGHARGDVEELLRPAPHRGDDGQPRIGVHRHGVPHRFRSGRS